MLKFKIKQACITRQDKNIVLPIHNKLSGGCVLF